MSRPLVAVMLGGPSNEHEVSLASGRRVLEEIDQDRFESVPIFVDREARWHFAVRPFKPIGADWPARLAGDRPYIPGVTRDMPWRPDVVFIALHGAYGEDGQLQVQLTDLGVRFTGSGPEASRLAINKVLSRERFSRVGFPIARGWEILTAESSEVAARRILAEFPGPFVVKPRDGGSSVGVRMAAGADDLASAIAAVLRHGEPILVEERVDGIELTCGVLEELTDRTPRALPVTEIVPPQDGFFDYVAKYTAGKSQEITPARIDAAAAARAQEIAIGAHTCLGCSAYSRSDFMLSRDGRLVLLELNTLPGLTATSLLPQEAAAAGLSYRDLITHIIELAR
jgi:D-alanine-D-alanine ligase